MSTAHSTFNKRTARLETLLTSILQGRPVLSWVEERVDQLLRDAGQSTPPLELRTGNRLFRTCRIEALNYIGGLPERGRLSIGGEGFNIILRRHSSGSPRWLRYTIAHEIAHILLFSTTEWPPIPIVSIEAGSAELEWLCNYIARALLLPRNWLVADLNGIDASENTTLAIKRISERYIAPMGVTSQRIIEDLGHCNSILLEFVGEPSHHDEPVAHGRVWRLRWSVRPAQYSSGLFIPHGRIAAGKKLLPKVTGGLLPLVSRSTDPSSGHRSGEFQVPLELFKGSLLGSLSKVLGDNQGQAITWQYLHSTDGIDPMGVLDEMSGRSKLWVAIRVPNRDLSDRSP